MWIVCWWIVSSLDSFYLQVRNLSYLTLITDKLYKMPWSLLGHVDLDFRMKNFPLLWEFGFGIGEEKQPGYVYLCLSPELMLSRLFSHREPDEHATTRQWDTTAPAPAALCPGQRPTGPDPPDWRGWTGPSSMYLSTSLSPWMNWKGGCGRDWENQDQFSLCFWITWIVWDEGKMHVKVEVLRVRTLTFQKEGHYWVTLTLSRALHGCAAPAGHCQL